MYRVRRPLAASISTLESVSVTRRARLASHRQGLQASHPSIAHRRLKRSLHHISSQASSNAFFTRNTEHLRSSSALVSLQLRSERNLSSKAAAAACLDKLEASLETIPVENIRNFSIIAHIDHGKSTLADRLLELSGNISKEAGASRPQYLDNLQVERDRGITVKAQTASMRYFSEEDGQDYLLNLVDTPGHVDFSYEVSRSLAACQGALLLVDSSQGIQAQTLANYRAATKAGLKILPVVTKIDLPHADPDEVTLAMCTAFDMDPDDVVRCSGKTGEGVPDIFEAVTKHIPPPDAQRGAAFRGMVFDSVFDDYRGVICYVKIVDGTLKAGMELQSHYSKQKYVVQEVGILTPERRKVKGLHAGHVGYVVCGMKETREAKIGDTLFENGNPVESLPGLEEAKPMVFASIYPVDNAGFDELRTAVEKLLLTDPSTQVAPESTSALGMGFRCGFLGLLHMEVFHQRLRDEHKISVIVTAPMVPFRIIHPDGTEEIVETPATFPNRPKNAGRMATVFEPMVLASIVTPPDYLGDLLVLLKERRGVQEEIKYLDDRAVVLTYKLPWQEVVSDFYDQLKTITAGYGSFDYEPAESEESDIVKVDILLNTKPVDALSFVCHRDKAEQLGRRTALKLKDVIDRQQFEVVIQAAVGQKIFARERIAPYRKDVLIKSGKTVGGGDVSRKKKLLAKQKEGKKRMKTVGQIQLSQDAFWSVTSKSS